MANACASEHQEPRYRQRILGATAIDFPGKVDDTSAREGTNPVDTFAFAVGTIVTVVTPKVLEANGLGTLAR